MLATKDYEGKTFHLPSNRNKNCCVEYLLIIKKPWWTKKKQDYEAIYLRLYGGKT